MSKLYVGSNVQRYFAARGVHLSPDESCELVRLFVRLADLGAITTASADKCPGSAPNTPASAGVSRADRGAGDGRTRATPAALGGPTVYNMGPSDYTGPLK